MTEACPLANTTDRRVVNDECAKQEQYKAAPSGDGRIEQLRPTAMPTAVMPIKALVWT